MASKTVSKVKKTIDNLGHNIKHTADVVGDNILHTAANIKSGTKNVTKNLLHKGKSTTDNTKQYCADQSHLLAESWNQLSSQLLEMLNKSYADNMDFCSKLMGCKDFNDTRKLYENYYTSMFNRYVNNANEIGNKLLEVNNTLLSQLGQVCEANVNTIKS